MASKRAAELSRMHWDGTRTASPVPTRFETSTNSKASSPAEASKSQVDFQFLTFTHPSEARASKARRTVRSHVTRQQHAREQERQAVKRTQSYQDASPVFDQFPLTTEQHAPALPAERPTTVDVYSTSGVITSTRSSPTPSPPSRPTDTPPPTCSHDRCIELAGVYPEEWQPYISRVMEHYLLTRAVDIPDVDGPNTKRLLRTRFFPFMMADPASFHAVMLMAASHYGRVCGSRTHAIDLLRLRGMAMREIKSALADPDRMTSDHLILAVAKMASYEVLFGDRDISHTHMAALTRMVTLRGGLPMLSLDGLLERLLLWIDANVTEIIGRPLYFHKAAFPTRAVHPRPDPKRFAAR